MKPVLFAACFCVSVLTASDRISFVRAVKPGMHFECGIRTVQSARYSFHLPGQEEPAVKLETVRADFQGYLTVLKVNASGNPVRLRLRIDRISGALNGRPLTGGWPPGTWVEADLSDGQTRFTTDGKEMKREFQALLRALFPPASESCLADFTGRSRRLPAPGQGWRPDLTAFLNQLAQRGVHLAPSAFKSGIAYLGRDQIDGKSCRKFSLLIETARLTDYDCRYKLVFWLSPEGPPVRLVRDATEIVRQVLRSSQPFAAGTRVKLLSEDHTEQTLIPVDRIPPLPSGRKAPGVWDALLR